MLVLCVGGGINMASTVTGTYSAINLPKVLSVLYISKSKEFRYHFLVKKPNLWWNFGNILYLVVDGRIINDY